MEAAVLYYVSLSVRRMQMQLITVHMALYPPAIIHYTLSTTTRTNIFSNTLPGEICLLD